MANVGFSEFRQNLARHFDRVVKSRAPLVVTRQRGASVVVMSEEEYESMQETLHLLSSPANAERLMRSVEELEAGRGAEHDLVEE